MKTKIAILLAFAAFIGIAASPQTIRLIWNGQAQVDAFKIYGTNDITAPLTNWPLLITVPGNVTQALYIMQPGQTFFYVTASNFWGESGPSNVTNTPTVATNPVAGITR